MDQLAYIVFPLFCALISCGAAVVAVSNARRPASVELQSHVDELTMLVEKMMKESRKERMTRVRQTALNPDGGSGSGNIPPVQVPAYSSVAERKAALRAAATRARGGVNSHVTA